jgi:hypothetical protein
MFMKYYGASKVFACVYNPLETTAAGAVALEK